MPAGGSIAVSVTDGVVTLSGETDTDAARRRAELGAMEVYGIRAIKNAIRISPVERSDPEIVADVKRRLASDARLRGGGIRAASNHGQVTLTGTVPSAAEKFRAAELSWVAGTSSVDPSDLRVAAPSGSPGSQPKIEPLTDADVRSALALALSREGSALRNLKVEVVDGTATLRGDAATLHAKYEAGNEARDVVGVKRVVNRLKVVPSDNPSDDTVRTRVESALRQSPYVRRHNLQATVANGVATLRGRTVSVFEKAQAERVVSRVPGVLAVQNRIEVEGPSKPYLHDPYVDELDSPDVALHDYRPLYTLQDDTEIRESIVSQLFWSPYVDADQVHVEVRNGVATLTGKVSSPEEARAAVKNAYDGGATAVINRMETSAETK
jgi:osmotically-inducible protein OsmY